MPKISLKWMLPRLNSKNKKQPGIQLGMMKSEFKNKTGKREWVDDFLTLFLMLFWASQTMQFEMTNSLQTLMDQRKLILGKMSNFIVQSKLPMK